MTKPIVKSVFTRAALAGVAIAASAGFSAAETTLKVGHVFAADHPWQVALEGLSKDVSEATDGEVVIEVYPSSPAWRRP